MFIVTQRAKWFLLHLANISLETEALSLVNKKTEIGVRNSVYVEKKIK